MKLKIASDVGDFLLEQILLAANEAKSPVSGERFPVLSKEYKKKKIAEGLGGSPNLTYEGDLLDAITFKPTAKGIEIGWWGDQAGKADGHANFSGRSKLPQRRLLPDEGQTFKRPIQSEIEAIIAEEIEKYQSKKDEG